MRGMLNPNRKAQYSGEYLPLAGGNAALAAHARYDEQKSIALHRAMCRSHLEKIESKGVKVDVERIKDKKYDEFFHNRAKNEARDGDWDKPIEDEVDVANGFKTRANYVGSSLYNGESEDGQAFFCEKYGIDEKLYKRNIGDKATEEFKTRSSKFEESREDIARYLVNQGLEPAQLAVAMDVYHRRSLDPATQTSQVGVDYLHDVYRVLRVSGKLQQFLLSMDLPAGWRSYTAPNIGDSQFLYQTANTTDALTVNTSVDPTVGSQTWTPLKFQSVTFWNEEYQEDALYEVEGVLRASIIRGAALMMDHVLLSGDTTNSAGANINANGGSLALGTKDPRVAMNGIRGMFFRGTSGGKSADTFTGGLNGSGNNSAISDVYAALKKLGKYAVPDQRENLLLIAAAQTWWNLRDNARGQNFGQAIQDQDVFGINYAILGNSSITNASSSNVPTYASWTSEGVPTNLNASGVYDATTTTMATWALLNRINYLIARKRQLTIRVVELPLGEQFAITAGMRFDFKEIIANEPAFTCAFNIK